MSETVTFTTLPYHRPNLSELEVAYHELAAGFDSAQNADEVVACVQKWNTLRTDVGTMHSLAEVHYTQDVSNEASKEEKNFFDANVPTIVEWNNDIAKRILKSPYQYELASNFGKLFLDRLSEAERTFGPELKDLMVTESELCNRYNEITASAAIEVDGVTYNLSSLGALQIDPDREVRKRAVQKQYEFLQAHAAEIDEIFDKLVKLRTEKAQRRGFDSYVDFRYVEFGRIDYKAADVEHFRKQVIDHVVPLVQTLRDAQARRLGLDKVKLYDEKLQFADGNPIAEGDHDWIVARAQTMYADLSGETREFFDLMLQRDLLDLKTRDNKATGGYCTSFPSYGLPFIFANFNRTTHDVEVLTHEAGHAFQAYRSRTFDIPEYRWPTAEACEIHSMGMEFLTWPWMDSFFGSQTEKFKFYHLQGAILFLPYGCAVDHFQHWVYSNPNATPAERNAMWKEMEATYLPWRDTSDVPYADMGTQWQFQRHIIESPFYYIDYALAQTCALQYWQRSLEDRKLAFEDYLRICDIGGSQPFLDIVRSGKLKSPFAEGTLQDIVDTAYGWLKKNYSQNL